MIVSKCPSCREAVTVPDAARSARVRCPLCQDEYTLGEVLERCPPLLEVLHAGEAGTDALLHDGGYELSSAAAAGVTAPAFDFSESAALKPEATPARSATAAPSPARRSKRKPRNPLIEIAKVVGGGVVGLFIAQMVLWWMPFFNLDIGQRDPLSLGRNIGHYVPWIAWIVPPQVRGETTSTDSSGTSGDDTQNKGGQQGSQTASTSSAGGNSTVTASTSRGADNGRDESPFSSDKFTGKPGQSDQSPNAAEPKTSEPVEVNVPPPQVAPPVELRRSGFKTPGEGEPDELAGAIAAAAEANAAYDAAANGTTALRMYDALSEVGSVLSRIDVSKKGQQQAHAEECRKLVSSLGTNKHTGISALAAQRLDDPQRAADGIALVGIALVGTVQSIETLEHGYYICATELGQDGKIVSVIGWGGRPHFSAGDKVFVLGVILDDPAARLIDFPGSGGQAVAGLFSQVLARAETGQESPPPEVKVESP
jgi:hypothetical protein